MKAKSLSSRQMKRLIGTNIQELMKTYESLQGDLKKEIKNLPENEVFTFSKKDIEALTALKFPGHAMKEPLQNFKKHEQSNNKKPIKIHFQTKNEH